jgi:hypothetical protein
MVTKCRVEAMSVILRVYSAMSSRLWPTVGNVCLRIVVVMGKLTYKTLTLILPTWKIW